MRNESSPRSSRKQEIKKASISEMPSMDGKDRIRSDTRFHDDKQNIQMGRNQRAGRARERDDVNNNGVHDSRREERDSAPQSR